MTDGWNSIVPSGQSHSTLFAASLVLAASLTGCGSGCALEACSPRAELYFEGVVQGPGDYVAEVETREGGVVTCEATLPLSDDDACSAGGVSWIVSGRQSTSGSGTTQDAADSITGVSVEGEHDTIQVRLYRDGVALGVADVQPSYLNREINGPGCGECRSATARVFER